MKYVIKIYIVYIIILIHEERISHFGFFRPYYLLRVRTNMAYNPNRDISRRRKTTIISNIILSRWLGWRALTLNYISLIIAFFENFMLTRSIYIYMWPLKFTTKLKHYINNVLYSSAGLLIKSTHGTRFFFLFVNTVI